MFRQIADSGFRAARFRAVRVGGYEFSVLERAAYVVVVPNFVQSPVFAAQCYFDARSVDG